MPLITLTNVNQFSKLLHYQNQQKDCNKTVVFLHDLAKFKCPYYHFRQQLQSIRTVSHLA